MDTKLSLMEIEHSVMRYFNAPFTNMAVCNISYGLLKHEVDVCILSKSNYLTEVEIKRSYSDFLVDFNKSHHHDNDIRIKKFYYCVPESIVDKVMIILKENVDNKTLKQLPAVLSYNESAQLKLIEESGKPEFKFHTPRPLNKDELIQFYRLGTFRLYNMQENIINQSKEYHNLLKRYNDGLATDKISKLRSQLYKEQEEIYKKISELVSKRRHLTESKDKSNIDDEINCLENKKEYIKGKLDAYFEITTI